MELYCIVSGDGESSLVLSHVAMSDHPSVFMAKSPTLTKSKSK